MKDSELLRKAKKWLEERPPTVVDGVCRAIVNASGEWNSQQAVSLKYWVASMLNGGEAYLTAWLIANRHVTTTEYLANVGLSLAKLKATRLAWLDWMIAECEKAEAMK